MKANGERSAAEEADEIGSVRVSVGVGGGGVVAVVAGRRAGRAARRARVAVQVEVVWRRRRRRRRFAARAATAAAAAAAAADGGGGGGGRRRRRVVDGGGQLGPELGDDHRHVVHRHLFVHRRAAVHVLQPVREMPWPDPLLVLCTENYNVVDAGGVFSFPARLRRWQNLGHDLSLQISLYKFLNWLEKSDFYWVLPGFQEVVAY